MHQEYLTDMVSAKNVLTPVLQYSQWTRMLVLHVYLSPPLLILLIIVTLVKSLWDAGACAYNPDFMIVHYVNTKQESKYDRDSELYLEAFAQLFFVYAK